VPSKNLIMARYLRYFLVVLGVVWVFTFLKNLSYQVSSDDYRISVPLNPIPEEVSESILYPELSCLSPFPKTYDVQNTETWPLKRYPVLPDNQTVACVPQKFGYTQKQANQLFNPNRKFRSCASFDKSFVQVDGNSIVINCRESVVQYVLGTRPHEELLGNVEYTIGWKSYQEPVPLEDREFAFVRCGRAQKQPIYINKFQKKASQRALSITKSISSELKVTPKPLTVLLVVFDSVSRQHFYRNFPQTIEFLNREFAKGGRYQEKFSFYDFLINNVHGENTQPNMVPLLYGYNMDYHKSRLQGYDLKNQSHWWKFEELQKDAMWKHYESLGFVTMFGYDTVWDFLSKCTGRRVLTDHVASNFWHAAKKIYGYLDFSEKQRCLGYYNSHYYMLDYAKQFVKNYEGHNRFGYIHLSPGHESSGTVIRTADLDSKNFLEEVFEYYFKNSEDFVLMFASDHGKHSREWDKSAEGYLENQLPLHLLVANKDFIQKHGEETDATLKHNTKRLVGRLDWHLTLKHLAVSPYGLLPMDSYLYYKWKNQTDSSKAVSLLLEKVPESRTCEDLSIPSSLCSCQSYVSIPLEEAVSHEPIQHLVALGFEHINAEAQEPVCKTLTFKELLEAEVKYLKEKTGNRNFRLKVNTQEDPKAMFEVHGLMAVSQEMKGHLQKDSKGNFLPFKDFEYSGFLSESKFTIQLQNVIRIDSYAGICEEMAKSTGNTAAYCVCNKPHEVPRGSVESVLKDLLKRLSVNLGPEKKSCEQVCREGSSNCLDWGFEVVKAKDHIVQSNLTEFNLNADGKRLSLQEAIEYKDSWSLSGSLNCAQVPKFKAFCPCSS